MQVQSFTIETRKEKKSISCNLDTIRSCINICKVLIVLVDNIIRKCCKYLYFGLKVKYIILKTILIRADYIGPSGNFYY